MDKLIGHYIENNHEPILDREKWGDCSVKIARRKKFREQHKLQFYIMQKENNPFTTKVFCAECGSAFAGKIGLQVEVNVRYGSVIIDIGLKDRLDV